MNSPGSLAGARSAGVLWSAASLARPSVGVWSKTLMLRPQLCICPILELLSHHSTRSVSSLVLTTVTTFPVANPGGGLTII